MSHVSESPPNIIATDAAVLESDPEAIGAVIYKPPVDRDTHVAHHNDMEAKHDSCLKLE